MEFLPSLAIRLGVQPRQHEIRHPATAGAGHVRLEIS